MPLRPRQLLLGLSGCWLELDKPHRNGLGVQTNPTEKGWGCSCESGLREELLLSVPGNRTLLAARGRAGWRWQCPARCPSWDGWGQRGQALLPSVSAQAGEGLEQKSRERVESRNKGTPAARERLPLLAAESAGQ